MTLDCRACGACCVVLADDGDPRVARVLDTDDARLVRVPARDGRAHLPVVGDRCTHLAGDVGAAVFCTVYGYRPYVCRAFPVGGKSCLAARAIRGL